MKTTNNDANDTLVLSRASQLKPVIATDSRSNDTMTPCFLLQRIKNNKYIYNPAVTHSELGNMASCRHAVTDTEQRNQRRRTR